MEDTALFLLTVLIILGTPGPTNTLLATSGAAVGWRRSLILLPAEAAGYLVSILFLGLVLGPIVAASPAIALTLRLAVGSYLLALALKLWRRGTVLEDGPIATVRPHQVFVTTLLNPKAIIFALGVVPLGSPHVWIYLLAFVVLLTIVAFSWIILGAAMGRVARANGQERIVPRVGAVAICCFALLIVASPFVR
ncbi:LysE family translocator [Roseomonas terrae]|uniref:LysE family translocator n=1 Tax=Neoroseomonas terrae TaxID=424799 RepID=A0ABS5ECB2_9PROT|nr:LysE family translocator [Neoroseomonas terrae]MBR0648658.1 LysE family translocator [Neoroseomonas terrae]